MSTPTFVKTKKDLADKVAEKLGISKKDAAEAVTVVFDEITDTLTSNGEVSISGFGMFTVSERPARSGINPFNKEPIEIAASKSPKFKASKTLKEKF